MTPWNGKSYNDKVIGSVSLPCTVAHDQTFQCNLFLKRFQKYNSVEINPLYKVRK
jgi:hypothetical protein